MPGIWQIQTLMEAQTPGFSALGFDDYKWTLSGFGGLGTVQKDYYLYPFNQGPAPHKREVVKSGFKPGEIKGQTTTVDVTVTDPNDGATGDASYNITWHLPYTNWDFIDSKRLSPQKFAGRGVHSQNSVGKTDRLVYDDSDLEEIEVGDLQGTLSKFSALANGAASGATLVYLAAGVSNPPAGALAALGFAGEILGAASEFADGPPPTTERDLPTDYESYKAHLTLEKYVDEDPENPGTPIETSKFIGDQNTIDALLAEAAKGEAQDGYWQGTKQGVGLSVSGFIFRNRTRFKYKGDHYDSQGYVGRVPGNRISFGGRSPRMTWTLGTVTPGANSPAPQPAASSVVPQDSPSGGNS